MSQITAREFDKLMWDFNRKIERLEKINAIYKGALEYLSEAGQDPESFIYAEKALAKGAAIAGHGVE